MLATNTPIVMPRCASALAICSCSATDRVAASLSSQAVKP
jgi:hypothetical protein